MTIDKLIKVILLFSAHICLVACGESSSSYSNVGTSTQIIASVEPQNNATLSIIPKEVTVTFNKAMNPATITVSSFTVSSNGLSVNGTVTYNSANSTATFIPSSDFVTNATYICTIKAGVKTLSGISLISDYVWKFTNDTVPLSPTISQSAVGNSITITWAGVQGAVTYNLYWSETSPYSTAGLSFSNKITNIGAFSYTHNNLLSDKIYYYAMTAVNAKGESNYSNVECVNLDASNGAAVISTSPAANETEVPINDTWNWTPNKLTLKAVYNATFTTAKPIMSVVDSNGDPVEVMSHYDIDTSVVLYDFTSDLKYNTTYTATISGNPATGNDYSWKFTTVESAPVMSYTITPPHRVDISWTPVKGATSYNFVFFWLDSIFDPGAHVYTGLTGPFWLDKPILTADHSLFYYWIVAVKGTKPISISNSISLTGIP